MPTTPSLYEWLSHPLLLLVVGAALSSYIVPLLTRRWQNHQKELELKTNLIGQISEFVTDFLMVIQFAVIGAKSQSQEDFDTAYREWETARAKIASYLQAYFPTTNISREWDHFSELVSDFYALTGIFDEPGRRKHLKKIQGYALPNKDAIDWNLLASRSNLKEFLENWDLLRQQILKMRDAVIQSVINARITSF